MLCSPLVIWSTYFLIARPVSIFLWSAEWESDIFLLVSKKQALACVTAALFKSLSSIGFPCKKVKNNSKSGRCKKFFFIIIIIYIPPFQHLESIIVVLWHVYLTPRDLGEKVPDKKIWEPILPHDHILLCEVFQG